MRVKQLPAELGRRPPLHHKPLLSRRTLVSSPESCSVVWPLFTVLRNIGVVLPRVRLYCLENGSKVLHCDPGTHQAAHICWTLEGEAMDETQAFFQDNKRIISVARGIMGNISCIVGSDAGSLSSRPVMAACEGYTWFFYSVIMAAAGGGACLLSLIVCSISCCCRRRSGHLRLEQEEFELRPVVVETKKKPSIEVVHEVEETTPITKNTTPNMKPDEDDFQFPTPPDMGDLRPEQDDKATMEERSNTSAAGSEESNDGHDDNPADDGSSGIHGN